MVRRAAGSSDISIAMLSCGGENDRVVLPFRSLTGQELACCSSKSRIQQQISPNVNQLHCSLAQHCAALCNRTTNCLYFSHQAPGSCVLCETCDLRYSRGTSSWARVLPSWPTAIKTVLPTVASSVLVDLLQGNYSQRLYGIEYAPVGIVAGVRPHRELARALLRRCSSTRTISRRVAHSLATTSGSCSAGIIGSGWGVLLAVGCTPVPVLCANRYGGCEP